MTSHHEREQRHAELGPDADALTLVNRAVDMARRRLRYRIAAALTVAAMVAVALVLFR
jgi:hypothetical protein